MKTKIKICGFTRPEDVECLKELDVDFAGFIFVPESPRYLPIEAAREIIPRVPSGVGRVGVFADAAEDEIREIIRAVPLDILQFHGHESPAYCECFGLSYFKALRVKQAINFHYLSLYNPLAFLLDTFVLKTLGGTGKTFNWDLAVEAKTQRTPIILAGGLTPENVAGAIRKVRPWGVDVSSGVESRPGIKDHEKIRVFVESVRNAEKTP
jgi:phosphoribosylanthranilate isomerase